MRKGKRYALLLIAVILAAILAVATFVKSKITGDGKRIPTTQGQSTKDKLPEVPAE